MKKRFVFLLFLLFLFIIVCPTTASAADGDVAINSTNFPDRNFRSIILNSFDTDKNGILSESETAGVIMMYVDEKSITDLKGIEYFTALDYLKCNGNSLTSLDISKNTALTSLCCTNNRLTSLDLSSNTELKDLVCDGNLLTELDLSNNPNLSRLSCSGNPLTVLDVSDHSKLSNLSCGNPELTEIYCDNCFLQHLFFYNCPALQILSCSNNPLATLDISNNRSLLYLDCSLCSALQTLNTGNNEKLVYLSCIGSPLKELNIYNNADLAYLLCFGTPIEKVDISCCPTLIEAYTEGELTQIEEEGLSVSMYICNDDYGMAVDTDSEIVTDSCIAVVTGVSLNLQEKISVQFKIRAFSNVAYAELRVQKPDGGFAAPVKVVLDKSNADVYRAGEDRYVVAYSDITTKMISQGIKLTVYDKNGNTMGLYRTSDMKTYTQSDPLVYSAADWCNAAIRKYGTDIRNKTSWLAQAVLNLGGEAQKYFDDYNPDHPANPNNYLRVYMDCFRKDASYDLYMSDPDAKDKGYSGMSLDLAADTRLRVKFTADTDVTLDGATAELIKEGDKYVLDILGLRCIDLDQTFTVGFKATDGSNITLKMCAISWCNAAADAYGSDPANQTLKLAKAVCLYSEAAENYFK